LELFNYENLTKVTGQKAELVDDNNNRVELVILDVRKGSIDGEQWEAFSTTFKGDTRFQIPQGTYTVEHPSFGSQRLFLSPLNSTEYETVITRKRVNTDKSLTITESN